MSDFNKKGLNSEIVATDDEISHLSKKIAVLRVLTQKPKIVVIKDTSPFIGTWSIKELLEKYNPKCTIIKITNNLEVAYDCHRIIYL